MFGSWKSAIFHCDKNNGVGCKNGKVHHIKNSRFTFHSNRKHNELMTEKVPEDQRRILEDQADALKENVEEDDSGNQYNSLGYIYYQVCIATVVTKESIDLETNVTF